MDPNELNKNGTLLSFTGSVDSFLLLPKSGTPIYDARPVKVLSSKPTLGGHQVEFIYTDD